MADRRERPSSTVADTARLRRRPAASLACAAVAWLCLAGPYAAAGERRVVVGEDGRRPLEADAALEARFAATGRIECGGVRGIGQLTGRGDTVTSAAHVFFDEAGRSRAAQGRCVFIAAAAQGGGEWALTPDRDSCGSTSPYGSAGHQDWAVARLERPIPGIAPYRIGGTPRVGDRLTVVALEGRARTVEVCRVRAVVAGGGDGREIRTDCSGFDGLSGAAYLTTGARPSVVGLHVGFRSSHPGTAGPYAEDHYTFGAALEGGFARTLRSAAR